MGDAAPSSPLRDPTDTSARGCRLGFLGVGWIGRNRLEALSGAGAEVTAVVDLSKELAEDVARSAGAVVLPEFEALLDHELDGIVIATPSALHAEQSIAALRRGLAVFCQKPLARSASEAREVLGVAASMDRLLGVDLSYRHLEGVRKIRDLIQAGELGDLYAADLVFHNAHGPDKPWFYDPQLSGGGCLIDLGTHLVDLALWVMDFPKPVEIWSRLYSKGRPWFKGASAVEDYAIGGFTLNNGAVVTLGCSWKLSLGQDARIEAWFHGTHGGACLRNTEGSFYDFIAELLHGRTRKLLSAPPEAWGGRAAIDWARKLARSNRYDAGIETVLLTSEILDRMYDQ
jgi:predicted dehydrogenase